MLSKLRNFSFSAAAGVLGCSSAELTGEPDDTDWSASEDFRAPEPTAQRESTQQVALIRGKAGVSWSDVPRLNGAFLQQLYRRRPECSARRGGRKA